jgi:starch-binding outer membrane protein, SusD/RagB family
MDFKIKLSKMKKNILAVLVFAMLLVACKKDFLDRKPIDKLTEATAFVTYDNFKTYSWGLYDYMAGYGGSGSALPPYFTSQELNSDNYQTSAGSNSAYIAGNKVAPTTAGSTTSSMQIAQWNFAYVRRVNVMLDHIDASSMTQTEKDHWRSVGYFFRALRYFDMIAAFGDVPWIENAINIDDSTVLYAPRTSRDTVAMNILNNLVWASEHIKTGGDGANTINVHVVRALISRFGLFEGTWRKYHGLPNANTYLQACVDYSKKLLTDFPTILPSYDDVYNSEDLVGKPGIILCKQYVSGMLINGSAATTHHTARFITTGNSGSIACATNDMVESYLCADGSPISTSATYHGDSIYSAFRNRDRRLYFTVCPPYRVTMSSNPVYGWSQPWQTFDTSKTPSSNYNEFIRLMNSIAPATASKAKTLPMLSWAPAPGNYIPQMPHFAGYIKSLNNVLYDNGANGVSGQASNVLGYKDWKLYNRITLDASNGSSNDCPIFRIEEVLLNYAEAAFELGIFNQSIADQTINKLRPRANVPNMVVANITASFDTKRDVDVDPVLWEIRRERRVELMGDGFRFNDIKRWNKGQYMNKIVLGARVRVADYPSGVTFDATTGTTYKNVRSLFTATPAWNDKYYLEPIPTQEIVINPNLRQTTGWQ